jgi:hypothetical protein
LAQPSCDLSWAHADLAENLLGAAPYRVPAARMPVCRVSADPDA